MNQKVQAFAIASAVLISPAIASHVTHAAVPNAAAQQVQSFAAAVNASAAAYAVPTSAEASKAAAAVDGFATDSYTNPGPGGGKNAFF